MEHLTDRVLTTATPPPRSLEQARLKSTKLVYVDDKPANFYKLDEAKVLQSPILSPRKKKKRIFSTYQKKKPLNFDAENKQNPNVVVISPRKRKQKREKQKKREKRGGEEGEKQEGETQQEIVESPREEREETREREETPREENGKEEEREVVEEEGVIVQQRPYSMFASVSPLAPLALSPSLSPRGLSIEEEAPSCVSSSLSPRSSSSSSSSSSSEEEEARKRADSRMDWSLFDTVDTSSFSSPVKSPNGRRGSVRRHARLRQFAPSNPDLPTKFKLYYYSTTCEETKKMDDFIGQNGVPDPQEHRCADENPIKYSEAIVLARRMKQVVVLKNKKVEKIQMVSQFEPPSTLLEKKIADKDLRLRTPAVVIAHTLFVGFDENIARESMFFGNKSPVLKRKRSAASTIARPISAIKKRREKGE